ncbi:hypothetical protein OIU77_000391 [Salix suchowensis]|uniref:Uncharacterized protein n=1 Tax=Salix suchowensis TaxID=1278906 RepID=A0ABQ9B897_9ROSI|nr:hypothetical protein OIU77_000391 [Salix suchowensis]
MSTIPNCPDQWNSSRSSPEESDNKNHVSRNNNMVALACLNCHLLVILSFLPQLQVSPLFPSPPIATEKSLPRQVLEHSTPPELMASARDRSAHIFADLDKTFWGRRVRVLRVWIS